jgi:hypothetical protein
VNLLAPSASLQGFFCPEKNLQKVSWHLDFVWQLCLSWEPWMQVAIKLSYRNEGNKLQAGSKHMDCGYQANIFKVWSGYESQHFKSRQKNSAGISRPEWLRVGKILSKV